MQLRHILLSRIKTNNTNPQNENKNSFLTYFMSVGIHIIFICLIFPFWGKYIPVFHDIKPDRSKIVTTFEVTTTAFTVMKNKDILAYEQSPSGEFIVPQNQLTLEPQLENTAHLTEYEPPLLPDIKPEAAQNNFKASENAPAISAANTEGNIFGNKSSTEGTVLTTAQLSTVPKQTVEVFPQMAEKSIKGSVSLTLRIGLDGRVKDYKIIKNTMDCPECLKKIIEAAQKSRWEKVTYQGNQVEYWIDKSYIFN